MNIKVHTAVLLAVCTITGFVIGLALVIGYRNVEAQSYELGPNSVALKDVSRLEQLVGQWLLTADLVLNGESFMLKASGRQSSEILELIEGLRSSSLVAENLDELAKIEYAVRRVQEIIEDTADIGEQDRERRLRELVDKNDEFSRPLVPAVQTLADRLALRSRYHERDLARHKSTLQTYSIFAAVFYLLVVGFAWLWTVRTMVRPIENLSLAAERAQLNERDAFALDEQGPDEVRRLTRNVSAFVSRMHHARERTEQEVRDRTAQLVKANKAKGEFLATMSHELRTPLNGIINMNELILDTGLDTDQRQCAETAKTAAEALLGLINDILDFSKIEAKKLQLETTPFSIHEVAEGAVEIVSGVAESKGIALATVVEHDVPEVVNGDPTRLRQILMNLLNNALKFTEEGHVVARISCTLQTENDAVLRFEVQDTGIGIPESRLDALFKAFEQADSSTTRRFGGTGLGLAICKELTELMGGAIGVDSEEGAGSTFWFTISVDRPAATTGQERKRPQAADRALILSSRPLVREQSDHYLHMLGFDDEARLTSATASEARVRSFLDGASEAYVLVDPTGWKNADWTALATLRSASNSTLHVCVLEHLLRRRSAPAVPIDVVSISEPLKLKHLRDWIENAASMERLPVSTKRNPVPVDRLSGIVLVAEDNLINQRVATKILERAGLQVITVEHGELAVDYVETHSVDLILMDCQMPVMDGLHATRVIRELEAAGQLAGDRDSRLPIVACTANALEGERKKCFDVGMDDYLSKPFKPAELLTIVETGLQRGGCRV